MKYVKKEVSQRKRYKPVVISLDDLDAIMAILRNAGCERIDLSNKDYRFETLDEAKELFGSSPTCDFAISTYKPSASIDFDGSSTTLFVSASPTSRQLFHELDDVVARCQRPFRVIFSYWMLVVVTMPWIVSFAWEPKYAGIPISLVVQLVLFVPLILGIFISLQKHSVIVFQRRHERQTFLVRNRDAILLTVVSSLISGGIGYGFAKLKEPTAPTITTPVEAPK
jgi:hypothetical protein